MSITDKNGVDLDDLYPACCETPIEWSSTGVREIPDTTLMALAYCISQEQMRRLIANQDQPFQTPSDS